jgi:hypothetical protein
MLEPTVHVETIPGLTSKFVFGRKLTQLLLYIPAIFSFWQSCGSGLIEFGSGYGSGSNPDPGV